MRQERLAETEDSVPGRLRRWRFRFPDLIICRCQNRSCRSRRDLGKCGGSKEASLTRPLCSPVGRAQRSRLPSSTVTSSETLVDLAPWASGTHTQPGAGGAPRLLRFSRNKPQGGSLATGRSCCLGPWVLHQVTLPWGTSRHLLPGLHAVAGPGKPALASPDRAWRGGGGRGSGRGHLGTPVSPAHTEGPGQG